MTDSAAITEADILQDLLATAQEGWSAEAARSVLALRFSPKTNQRIRRLLQKNNRGAIAAQERVALEKYLRVGQFLDLWQARARLALREMGKPS